MTLEAGSSDGRGRAVGLVGRTGRHDRSSSWGLWRETKRSLPPQYGARSTVPARVHLAHEGPRPLPGSSGFATATAVAQPPPKAPPTTPAPGSTGHSCRACADAAMSSPASAVTFFSAAPIAGQSATKANGPV